MDIPALLALSFRFCSSSNHAEFVFVFSVLKSLFIARSHRAPFRSGFVHAAFISTLCELLLLLLLYAFFFFLGSGWHFEESRQGKWTFVRARIIFKKGTTISQRSLAIWMLCWWFLNFFSRLGMLIVNFGSIYHGGSLQLNSGLDERVCSCRLKHPTALLSSML
jgi:hypothetical protein